MLILSLTLNLQGPVSLSCFRKYWRLLSSGCRLKTLIYEYEIHGKET